MGVFPFCTTRGVKRAKDSCNETRTIHRAACGAKTKEKPAEANRRDIAACNGSKNRDPIEQFCSHRASSVRVTFRTQSSIPRFFGNAHR
jgi:hypothetical protein